jgi:hypothetical protein
MRPLVTHNRDVAAAANRHLCQRAMDIAKPVDDGNQKREGDACAPVRRQSQCAGVLGRKKSIERMTWREMSGV